MTKIVFFDCDDTLWISKTKTYISSIDSGFKLVDSRKLIRKKDGLVFTLKPGILELFAKLKGGGFVLGIVSDNKPESVMTALKLFGLSDFIDPKAINIKLWKGYCPKHEMILEVLQKSKFKNILPLDVYWIDDKNYGREAHQIGVNFIKVGPRKSISRFLYEKLTS